MVHQQSVADGSDRSGGEVYGALSLSLGLTEPLLFSETHFDLPSIVFVCIGRKRRNELC